MKFFQFVAVNCYFLSFLGAVAGLMCCCGYAPTCSKLSFQERV